MNNLKNPDIWEHNFVPAKITFNFLRQKEREIIDTLMKDFNLDTFFNVTKKELIAVKNTDRVRTLDLNCATLNCFLNSSKDYEIYDMNDLVHSVKNLIGGMTNNKDHIGIRHDKSKILSRSASMLLSLCKTLQDFAFFKDVYLDGKNDFIFEELQDYLDLMFSKEPFLAYAFILSSRLFNLPIDYAVKGDNEEQEELINTKNFYGIDLFANRVEY